MIAAIRCRSSNTRFLHMMRHTTKKRHDLSDISINRFVSNCSCLNALRRKENSSCVTRPPKIRVNRKRFYIEIDFTRKDECSTHRLRLHGNRPTSSDVELEAAL
jgi:hypothetical protein